MRSTNWRRRTNKAAGANAGTSANIIKAFMYARRAPVIATACVSTVSSRLNWICPSAQRMAG